MRQLHLSVPILLHQLTRGMLLWLSHLLHLTLLGFLMQHWLNLPIKHPLHQQSPSLHQVSFSSLSFFFWLIIDIEIAHPVEDASSNPFLLPQTPCRPPRLSMVWSRSRKLWTWTWTCIGPGHKLFFRFFTNFYEFKLIFSYFLSIFSLLFNDICYRIICHCHMLIKAMQLSFLNPPTSSMSNNPSVTTTTIGNNNNGNSKYSHLTMMMVRAQEGSWGSSSWGLRSDTSQAPWYIFFFLF